MVTGERTTVIFTGQSGLDKRSAIEELKALAESRGRSVGFFSVGDILYEKSRTERGRILRLPLWRLELLRSQIVSDIVGYGSKHPADDLYIDTHATFRWEGGLFSGFTAEEIASLNPDLCICFIADVDAVKRGLAYSDFPLPLSLRDIMIWREEEILGSSLMAGIAGCRHYVVPRCIGLETLYRLVHRRESRKVYLSFPISRALPKAVNTQIEEFRGGFRSLESCVTFDPLELTEEPKLLSALKRALKERPPATTVQVEASGEQVHLDVQELQEIKRYIEGQTRSLDYRMVDQTDTTVALIPTHDGSPFRADGVFMEIAYAQQKAKQTYLIWPATEESPSLMINPDATFRTVEQALDYFK